MSGATTWRWKGPRTGGPCGSPGSPWENGYIESFIGKIRDELLNGEVLGTLDEAKVLYGPPAPEALVVKKLTLGLAQC